VVVLNGVELERKQDSREALGLRDVCPGLEAYLELDLIFN
jgi:hypothetical protein